MNLDSNDLFEVIREALRAEWLSDDEMILANKQFRMRRTSREDERGQLEHHDIDAPPERFPDIRLDILWSVLRERLSAMPTGAIPLHAVTVRSLRTRRLEASTLASSDGALILVDAALHDLIMLHTSLILASQALPLERSDGSSYPGPVLELGTAVRAARSTHGYLRLTGTVGIGFDVSLPGELPVLEQRLIETVEMFILSHEYAHAYLGHLPSSGEGVAERVQFGAVAAEGPATSWSREFAADRFAAQLIFVADGGPLAPAETLETLLAIRIALFVLDESIETRYVAMTETHPNSDLRFANITSALFGYYGHTTVPAVERVVAPYIDKFRSYGHEPFALSDKLSTRLLSSECIRMADPRDEVAEGLDHWEWWEHVGRCPHLVIFYQWGLPLLNGANGDSDFLPSLVAAIKDAGSIAAWVLDEEGLEAYAVVALGEACFQERYLPEIVSAGLLDRAVDGLTFCAALSELRALVADDDTHLTQAVGILRAYVAERAEARSDGIFFTSAPSVQAAIKWLHAEV